MIIDKFEISLNNNITIVNGWSRKDCTQDKVQECVLLKFQAIVEDAQNRLEGYKTDVKLLNSGFWYPTNYYEALVEKAQTKRLEWGKKGPFFYGHAPKGFDHVTDSSMPGDKKISGYVLKNGMLPSEALKSVKESLCFIDCQEAIQLAQYEALLEILGENRFNEEFSSKNRGIVLSTNPKETPLDLFQGYQMFKLEDPTFWTSLKKGDQVFFANIPGYSVKHPNGEGGGFHALCSQQGDQRKFIAFGVPKEGVTKEGMIEVLVEEFNKSPLPTAMLFSKEFILKLKEKMPTHLEKENIGYSQGIQKMGISVEQFNMFAKSNPQQIGLQPNIRTLDAQKIQKLIIN